MSPRRFSGETMNSAAPSAISLRRSGTRWCWTRAHARIRFRREVTKSLRRPMPHDNTRPAAMFRQGLGTPAVEATRGRGEERKAVASSRRAGVVGLPRTGPLDAARAAWLDQLDATPESDVKGRAAI